MNEAAPVDALWRRFKDRLRTFVRGRVPDEPTADDVLQDAFLKMHQRADTIGALEEPSAWVFAVTRNAIVDHQRRESARTRRERNFREAAPILLRTDEDAATELTRCMAPLLRALDAPYREALEMTALNGLSQAAAAREAGISETAMKSRVRRGRLKLRRLLARCCAIEVDVRGAPIEAVRRPGQTGCGCDPEP